MFFVRSIRLWIMIHSVLLLNNVRLRLCLHLLTAVKFCVCIHEVHALNLCAIICYSEWDISYFFDSVLLNTHWPPVSKSSLIYHLRKSSYLIWTVDPINPERGTSLNALFIYIGVLIDFTKCRFRTLLLSVCHFKPSSINLNIFVTYFPTWKLRADYSLPWWRGQQTPLKYW